MNGDFVQIELPVETLEQQLRAACILECTVCKPGNVSPAASFRDVTYQDFVISAQVSAPILAQSAELGAGLAIRNAVLATRDAVGSNTNLGMLLLLAPLAVVPTGIPCQDGIDGVLKSLDLLQTEYIYEAIRLAQPGGLGNAASNDVDSVPTIGILEAMALAPHDRVAQQFTNQFFDVLGEIRQRFLAALQEQSSWEYALLHVHVEQIALHSDSLILRKCGPEIARQVQDRAREVMEQWRTDELPISAMEAFDKWLREDGHRRNPGTTADLLAAMLFGVIRDREWVPPVSVNPKFDFVWRPSPGSSMTISPLHSDFIFW